MKLLQKPAFSDMVFLDTDFYNASLPAADYRVRPPYLSFHADIFRTQATPDLHLTGAIFQTEYQLRPPTADRFHRRRLHHGFPVQNSWQYYYPSTQTQGVQPPTCFPRLSSFSWCLPLWNLSQPCSLRFSPTSLFSIDLSLAETSTDLFLLRPHSPLKLEELKLLMTWSTCLPQWAFFHEGSLLLSASAHS